MGLTNQGRKEKICGSWKIKQKVEESKEKGILEREAEQRCNCSKPQRERLDIDLCKGQWSAPLFIFLIPRSTRINQVNTLRQKDASELHGQKLFFAI